MKIDLKIFFIFSLIALNLFSFKWLNNSTILNKKDKEIFKVESLYRNTLLKSMLLNENRTIGISTLIDVNGKKFKLENEVSNSESKLIFVIPTAMCHICYDQIFKEYINISKSMGISKTFVLCSKETFREVNAIFKAKSISIAIYSCDVAKMGVSAANGDVPFFFVLDKDLRAKNFYLPHKSDSNLTVFYLNQVQDIILKPQKSR